ncbi:hypothetical protein D5086_031014 [Populus alba]|uniref:Uncharacterized protein n=1 Tax=Populus alba TaxID=43335 RepID=A0ACC4AQ29_POPAL
MVNEGIKDKLDFKSLAFDSSNDTFRIADFGCAVGPNTFFAVENIIKAVEHKHHAQFNNSPPLAFQVFFNDVPTNDFNTLFKTLHPNRKYLAAGLPGTFYGRLLPKSTLHFACSSYCLQWLSKAGVGMYYELLGSCIVAMAKLLRARYSLCLEFGFHCYQIMKGASHAGDDELQIK